MTLVYRSAIPLYEQIVQDIEHEILSGTYNESRKLPTEKELMHKYDVSRITIRRAVSELAEKGLIEKKQGKGTFLVQPKMQKAFDRPGMSFTQMCAMNGVEAGAKMLESKISTPEDPLIVERLGIEDGEYAVRIKRLRTANGIPLVIEDNYFPIKYSYLLDVDLERDSLYRYLQEEKGIQIVAGHLSLFLVRADTESAKLLGIKRGMPLLRTDGCTYTGQGGILHTSQQIGYGENFRFIVRQ